MANSPRSSRTGRSAQVGHLLREWRATRRLSQLRLALEAGVSSRHLSFVESGRAQPSREMVARLADALEVPLRSRNALLVAAGYAPVHRETPLAAPEFTPVRRAIDCILAQQEPYPAFVTNRYWDLLLVNKAADRLFAHLKEGKASTPNVLRHVFDPDDMRPYIANWEEVAGELVRHLHADLAAAPEDRRMQALLEGVLAAPGVPAGWRSRDPGTGPLPLLTTIFRKGDEEFQFFSAITTFGTPRDVTLEELRIECMFPMDEATARRCSALAT